MPPRIKGIAGNPGKVVMTGPGHHAKAVMEDLPVNSERGENLGNPGNSEKEENPGNLGSLGSPGNSEKEESLGNPENPENSGKEGSPENPENPEPPESSDPANQGKTKKEKTPTNSQCLPTLTEGDPASGEEDAAEEMEPGASLTAADPT